jgi:carbon monoxide dehydrogenase subunit G
MIFEQEITVEAPPEQVWAFLWEVDRVARCLPGCREVRTLVPHQRYEAVVSERVGPFKVQFPLEIEVLEAEAPTHLRAQAAGRDASMGSSMRATLDLRIEGRGAGSRLVIHSDVAILGKLGTLGHGIIQPKAEGIISQFAEAMRRELQAGTAAC